MQHAISSFTSNKFWSCKPELSILSATATEVTHMADKWELHTLKSLYLCSLPVCLKLGLLQPLIRAGSLLAQACSLQLLLSQPVLNICSALLCQTEVPPQLLQVQISAGHLRSRAVQAQGVASSCRGPYLQICSRPEHSRCS